MSALVGALLHWLGQALLWGTVLALVTAAILALVGRRARPAVHAILWLVVLVKFVVPVGPSWDLSLASGFGALARLCAARDGGAAPIDVPLDDAKPGTIATAVVLAWVVGVALVGGGRLARHRRLAASCRRLLAAERDVVSLVADACRRLGVRRVPEVRTSPDATAPFVLGVLRPLLVLSRRHLARSDELEAIVLHEVAHLRRGDLLARRVQWLAGTLLFFWPVVAWVNRRLDLARELACDAWALRLGRLSPADYARCLLAAIDRRVPRRLAPDVVAMAAGRAHLRQRIDAILESAPTRRGQGTFALFVGAWAIVSLAGAATTRAVLAREDLDVRIVRFDGATGDDALARFLAAHRQADANHDGRLNASEFQAIQRERESRLPPGSIVRTSTGDGGERESRLAPGSIVRTPTGDGGERATRRIRSPNGDVVLVTEDVVNRR